MANIRTYAELKEFPPIQKTIKFKQARLMRSVVNDDLMLDELSKLFCKFKIDTQTAKKYVSEIGACSVFCARWLSELLGVNYEDSLRQPQSSTHGVVVMQSMMRNVFLKEVVGKSFDSTRFMPTLLELHGLRATGQSIELTAQALPLIAQRNGSYLIECGPINNHAVAITDLLGGMFFDPNAGEYSFSTAMRNQRKQFLGKWLDIYVREGLPWEEFNCYQVVRQ